MYSHTVYLLTNHNSDQINLKNPEFKFYKSYMKYIIFHLVDSISGIVESIYSYDVEF